jgi:hypothetical protein
MTFRELIRIEEKARELGLDALEPEERKALEDFRKASAPLLKALASSPAIHEAAHPESIEALGRGPGTLRRLDTAPVLRDETPD